MASVAHHKTLNCDSLISVLHFTLLTLPVLVSLLLLFSSASLMDFL